MYPGPAALTGLIHEKKSPPKKSSARVNVLMVLPGQPAAASEIFFMEG